MKRTARKLVAAVTLCLLASSLYGQAQQAGQVTAQIPQGEIQRPGQRLPTEVGAAVLWEDLVQTTAHGRVRITLGDSSILNVGSDSNLRVTQHNAQTRETDLTLSFGKMRSRLQKLAPGQRFEIKTNTAVLGVIGTDFFVEATATLTRVIVYEGVVLARNINPNVRGEVRAGPGMIVLIYADQPPFAPAAAAANEVDQSVDDTSVGEALPPPPGRKPPPPWSKRKVIIVVAVAGAVAVGLPFILKGRTKATGCPVPSCP